MNVMFRTICDEALPEHKELQGKVFKLLGINHGMALCENDAGNKWMLRCEHIETYWEKE